MEMRSTISQAQRLVIKIGTNMLSRQADDEPLSPGGRFAGSLDLAYLHDMARQITALMRQGKQVLLVSSGAIGMGARELGLKKRVTEIAMRQACAAIGQPLLMEEYRRVFGVYGVTVAQILITRDDWDKRKSYLNLRNAVETLLDMNILPIFNENDTVSTAEIGNAFGDNDQLSAYIASKIDAEVLMLLTDIDALYDRDPRANPDARPLPYVESLTPEILAAAGDRGTEFSTGGMKTKLKAVEIARDAGCRVVLAHGRVPNLLARIIAGEELGTLFEAASPLRNRTRWIKNTRPQGTLHIDDGALRALAQKHSLLAKGLVSVEGVFDRGAVVQVNKDLKLVTSFSSDELHEILGKHSSEIERILGPGTRDVIARPEDMAWISEYHQG